ncbi:MAG: flagellar protein FlaG [Deltaproteobacteria bacterium]|nr:flagellar protein FlaG [Deltaproteobacteria bacterium]
MNEIQNIRNISMPATKSLETPKRSTGSAAAPSQTDPQPVPSQPVSDQDWEKLFKDLEIYALVRNFRLKFSVDEATGRTVIKIINPDTQKVIREIPPEEILKIAATLERLAKQIIDTRA